MSIELASSPPPINASNDTGWSIQYFIYEKYPLLIPYTLLSSFKDLKDLKRSMFSLPVKVSFSFVLGVLLLSEVGVL